MVLQPSAGYHDTAGKPVGYGCGVYRQPQRVRVRGSRVLYGVEIPDPRNFLVFLMLTWCTVFRRTSQPREVRAPQRITSILVKASWPSQADRPLAAAGSLQR